MDSTIGNITSGGRSKSCIQLVFARLGDKGLRGWIIDSSDFGFEQRR